MDPADSGPASAGVAVESEGVAADEQAHHAGWRRAADSPVAPIAAVAVFAALWRLGLLFLIDPARHPLNFDEGAYFTGARLLTEGHVMYRDFIAVHPPVLFYALAPFTRLGSPMTGLVAARAALCVVGGINAWLIGRIALRHVGRWAAATGALLYAVAPEVVLADRSVVVEPLLSLTSLLAVWAWIGRPPSDDDDVLDRRAWQAGLLLGLAGATKGWAVFLVVPLLLTTNPGRRAREVVRLALGAAASFVVVAGPMIARAPADFVDQVIRFQVLRPVDGAGLLSRVRVERLVPLGIDFDAGTNGLITIAGIVGVVALVCARRTGGLGRFGSFALSWFTVLFAALFLGAIHFPQYNAILGPAAGLSLAFALDRLWARDLAFPGLRVLRVAMVAILVLAMLHAARLSRAQALTVDPEPARVAQEIRGRDGCTFSFEAGWLLAAGQYPDDRVVGQIATDAFVGGLIAAIDAGETDQQFASPAAQALLRDAVERCPTVILGPRGHWHLASSMAWFTERYRPLSETGPDGIDVWVRRDGGP